MKSHTKYYRGSEGQSLEEPQLICRFDLKLAISISISLSVCTRLKVKSSLMCIYLIMYLAEVL